MVSRTATERDHTFPEWTIKAKPGPFICPARYNDPGYSRTGLLDFSTDPRVFTEIHERRLPWKRTRFFFFSCLRLRTKEFGCFSRFFVFKLLSYDLEAL